jgi:hypothetical protein
MKFEWDEAKSEACFRERGFDFEYAAKAFFDPNRIVWADKRYSYGEDRYQLLGQIENRLFAVVYSFQEKFFGVILHMLVLSHHKSRRGA